MCSHPGRPAAARSKRVAGPAWVGDSAASPASRLSCHYDTARWLAKKRAPGVAARSPTSSLGHRRPCHDGDRAVLRRPNTHVSSLGLCGRSRAGCSGSPRPEVDGPGLSLPLSKPRLKVPDLDALRLCRDSLEWNLAVKQGQSLAARCYPVRFLCGQRAAVDTDARHGARRHARR